METSIGSRSAIYTQTTQIGRGWIGWIPLSLLTQEDAYSQSQFSQGSQGSSLGRFLHNPKVVRLGEIKPLAQPSSSQSAEHGPISYVLMTTAKQMTTENMNDEYVNQHVTPYGPRQVVKMDTGKAYCIRLTPAVMLQRGKKVTIREHFAYRMQSRPNEAKTILRSRRLFQQFVVDGYAMIESQRLNYVRDHQQYLRVDKYKNLSHSTLANYNVACATNAEKSRKIVCARGGGATSRVGGDAIQVENKRYRCDSREVKHPDWLIHGLREVVMECNMVDIPMVGYPLHGPRVRVLLMLLSNTLIEPCRMRNG
ncbi:hypothetical protein JHK87_001441 [Glycine soja]|nr:hypothetical protein JHK87_001441 [Glycine soja]